MASSLLFTVGIQLLPLYEKYFSVELDGYCFTNDCSFSRAPITFKSKKQIILNCDPDCDCQIAFQLSHELCHATIPESVPNNLRWLEETFAILASRYFPYKIRCIDPSEYEAYFNEWFDNLQTQFSGDVAGTLQSEITNLKIAFGLDTDTFVPGTAYDVGDMVIYNHMIYECNLAHVAEEFESEKWDIVPIIVN